jgi:hypothetical protein
VGDKDQRLDDTEGHGVRGRYGTPDTDEPPSDGAQAEGHAMRGRPATPDTDKTPNNTPDTEGHSGALPGGHPPQDEKH